MTRRAFLGLAALLVLAVVAAGWVAFEAVNAGLAWLLEWTP